MATLRMTKNPCEVALAQVVASTWFWLTWWYCWPSTYQRICWGETLRSHSIAYVWKADWQVEPGQARLPPMPDVSLHGPPGLTPQCSVPQTVLTPLTFSMMSISPTLGQFV